MDEYKFKSMIDLNCAENWELVKDKIVMRASEYGTELFTNAKNGIGNKINMEENAGRKTAMKVKKRHKKTIYETSMRIRTVVHNHSTLVAWPGAAGEGGTRGDGHVNCRHMREHSSLVQAVGTGALHLCEWSFACWVEGTCTRAQRSTHMNAALCMNAVHSCKWNSCTNARTHCFAWMKHCTCTCPSLTQLGFEQATARGLTTLELEDKLIFHQNEKET